MTLVENKLSHRKLGAAISWIDENHNNMWSDMLDRAVAKLDQGEHDESLAILNAEMPVMIDMYLEGVVKSA